MYVNIPTWSWAECLCPLRPTNSHVEILPSNVGVLGGGARGGDQIMSLETSRRGSEPLLRGAQRAPSFCHTFCVSTQLEDCGHNLEETLTRTPQCWRQISDFTFQNRLSGQG